LEGVDSVNQKLLETIKHFIVDKIDPNFIILFGSQARGRTHRDSDVDIAFYKPSHGLSAFEIFTFAQELARLIKMDVDLIDLNEASTVFKAQIFSTGDAIYISNQGDLERYRMNAMSMYANLNVERKKILKSIVESGKVYDDRK